jgi:hypothetical protein
MLFKEIISVYIENLIKFIDLLIVKAGVSKYSYRWVVKERGFMLSSSVCIFSQVSEGWFEVE